MVFLSFKHFAQVFKEIQKAPQQIIKFENKKIEENKKISYMKL
jgi:hypothetical protein